MPNIDLFESQFRAAAKPKYLHRPRVLKSVLVVTDLPADAAKAYAERARPMVTFGPHSPVLTVLSADETRDLGALLDAVKAAAPDIVVTYRCLHSAAWKWPYTIGDHVEVLTQVTDAPVLLLPRVDTGDASADPLHPPRVVLAITDHVVGEERLVQWAAAMCPAQQWLVLAHVEDEATFDRYMEIISKVPDVDTDVAHREIQSRLQRDAHDWIASCKVALEETLGEDAPRVEDVVMIGRRMSTYTALVARREADLLVLNTKDADQMAIHGMAYPLMVEMRQIPLLLL
ncbi:MAG: hypothetical protein AAFV53_06350 [Myxococcota bacterium]